MYLVIPQTIRRMVVNAILQESKITGFRIANIPDTDTVAIETTGENPAISQLVASLQESGITDKDEEHAWFRHAGVLISRSDYSLEYFFDDGKVNLAFTMHDLPTYQENTERGHRTAIIAAIDQGILTNHAEFLRDIDYS